LFSEDAKPSNSRKKTHHHSLTFMSLLRLPLSSTSTTFMPSKNVQTIHFAPYTPTQLQNILQSRLSPLQSTELAANEIKKFFPPVTLMLLTKKKWPHLQATFGVYFNSSKAQLTWQWRLLRVEILGMKIPSTLQRQQSPRNTFWLL
jgi:hypothetical protein